MEQTGINQCLVFVGSMENHVADRMEDYAKQNDMKVVETIFKDDRAIDKLTYYIEREGIICIRVRSIWDILLFGKLNDAPFVTLNDAVPV